MRIHVFYPIFKTLYPLPMCQQWVRLSHSYTGAGPTKGVASVETFHFVILNAAIHDVDGIVFGCSNNNVKYTSNSLRTRSYLG